MFFGDREDEAGALHDEALRRLDARDLAGARELAARLRAMRWSGAFEIEALAARAEGDVAGAIRVLEAGTAIAPRSWSLHQLLGSFLDRAGRRAEALASFGRALACPEPWVASILYNRAVTHLHAGDPGSALADAERVLGDAGAPFLLDALRIALDALEALGRRDDARALVRSFTSTLAETDAQGRAELAGLEALAAIRAGDRDAARAALDRAIEARAARPERIDVLARLADEGDAGEVYRVTIVVPATDLGPEVAGYFRVLEVRARDEAHARGLAARLEPSAARASLAIHELVPLRSEPGPAGILHASGAALFAREGSGAM